MTVASPALPASLTSVRVPGRGLPILADAPHRDLCTDCGVSRSSDPTRCGRACQFIHPQYDTHERRVHGRTRDTARPDELFFGVSVRMLRASLRAPSPGAQWSGITTALCAQALKDGRVDAVIAMTSSPADRWQPVPALITDAEGLKHCRGMKMGYAPLVAVVEQAVALGYRRLAVVGIACQIHALRAIERDLGLDALYVVGTPCSDNTTTQRFHEFLALLSDRPDEIDYLEFLPDMHVELRFTTGERRRIPFLQLPLSTLPADFFPVTCRSCVDYTNALSDVTVGYMAGTGAQWLIVRNERGAALVDAMGDSLEVSTLGTSGDRTSPVRAFVRQLERVNGGMPLRRTPKLLRPLVSWAMTRFGPKGLEFARARVEMRNAQAILTLRAIRPRRLRTMVPPHAWASVSRYGIHPSAGEQPLAATRLAHKEMQ